MKETSEEKKREREKDLQMKRLINLSFGLANFYNCLIGAIHSERDIAKQRHQGREIAQKISLLQNISHMA